MQNELETVTLHSKRADLRGFATSLRLRFLTTLGFGGGCTIISNQRNGNFDVMGIEKGRNGSVDCDEDLPILIIEFGSLKRLQQRFSISYRRLQQSANVFELANGFLVSGLWNSFSERAFTHFQINRFTHLNQTGSTPL